MFKCPVCNYVAGKAQRSNNQNRYAHGLVFKMIADEMGEYDLDHVKDLMKHKFLTYRKATITKSGKTITEEFTRHTSELDTREMEDFLFKCRHWAREFLNIQIPEPNQPPLEE